MDKRIDMQRPLPTEVLDDYSRARESGDNARYIVGHGYIKIESRPREEEKGES